MAIRRMGRPRLWVASALLVLLILGGWVGIPVLVDAVPIAEAHAHVIASAGATLDVGSAAVVIPPGALSADADLSARLMRTSHPGPEVARVISPMLDVNLSQAALVHPATLILPTDGTAATEAGGAFYDPSTSQWIAEPTSATADGKRAAITVKHFSEHRLFTWNLSALVHKAAEWMGYRASRPTCASPPSDVELIVGGGVENTDPPLIGCVDSGEKGKVNAILVNNRAYGTVVQVPFGVDMVSPPSRGGVLDLLYQAAIGKAALGGDYLPRGGEVGYRAVSPGAPVKIASHFSLSTYSIDVAFDLAVLLAGKSPALNTISIEQLGVGADEVLGTGKCLADHAASSPPKTTRDAARDAIPCLGTLNKSWFGPLSLIQGIAQDLAAALDIGQDRASAVAGDVKLVHRDVAVPPVGPTQQPSPQRPTTKTFNRGDAFDDLCVVAWPTAPTRTESSIQMTMSCQHVPTAQFTLVDVVYDDPGLNVTPSTGYLRIQGTVEGTARSDYGFSELVVHADRVTHP